MMIPRLGTFVCLLCIVTTIQAQTETDLYPPSKMPDRVVLSWQRNPATSCAVSWRTDTTVQRAIAEIARVDATPDFQVRADSFHATTELLETGSNAAYYHTVSISGLNPETMYAYRVGDGKYWSEWFQFTTASTVDKPFSFVYFGDAQNDIKSMWSRCIRQAYATMPDIDFFVHAGDLVNYPNKDKDWGEWFHAGGWLFGTKAHLASPGNHEYYPVSREERALSKHWRPTFAFPENGPDELKETVYYLDYQGVRFIFLNTQAMKNDSVLLELQKEWLVDVLQDNPHRWTIVVQHHPIYSTALGRDNPEIRAVFQPIFEEYHVDLVLQGHDHTYGRGYNMKIGEHRMDKGPIYVVSVSGPKMYTLDFLDWLERVGSNTQLYQLIHVKGDELKFEAYTATGTLYDAFHLKKRANGKSTFKDMAPRNVREVADIPSRASGKLTEEQIQLYRQKFEAYRAKKERDY